jgi:hypothetical protein
MGGLVTKLERSRGKSRMRVAGNFLFFQLNIIILNIQDENNFYSFLFKIKDEK